MNQYVINSLSVPTFLEPEYDSHKSFYHKAFTRIDPITQREILYSYDTPIIALDADGSLHPLLPESSLDLYSRTTGRHVKEFVAQRTDCLNFNKAAYKKLLEKEGKY